MLPDCFIRTANSVRCSISRLLVEVFLLDSSNEIVSPFYGVPPNLVRFVLLTQPSNCGLQLGWLNPDGLRTVTAWQLSSPINILECQHEYG